MREVGGVVWWSVSGDMLAVWWRASDVASGEGPTPFQFYFLDPQRWEFIDYCLPADLIPFELKQSADGRFVSWVALGSDLAPATSVILDLHTGTRAIVKEYEILGWGNLSENQETTSN